MPDTVTKPTHAQAGPGPVYYETHETVIGPVTIAADASAVICLQFGNADVSLLQKYFRTPATPAGTAGSPNPAPENSAMLIVSRAFSQLQEYLDGKRTEFDLPLSPRGTAFQQKIWRILRTIPYGETMYYSQVAALAGSPKASRAVGMANHNNPIAIFIPCHRVIGKNGSLTGFAGGLDIKKMLLELERGKQPQEFLLS